MIEEAQAIVKEIKETITLKNVSSSLFTTDAGTFEPNEVKNVEKEYAEYLLKNYSKVFKSASELGFTNAEYQKQIQMLNVMIEALKTENAQLKTQIANLSQNDFAKNSLQPLQAKRGRPSKVA